MKALLVLSDTRSKLMPDVPSLKESGLPTIELIGWVGLGAPAGIPEDAKQWLAKSFRAALANPETIAKLAAISVEPLPPLDPEKFVTDQLKSWAETAKAVGIEPQ
jgi:tripartite-type tricarboxylate transporter receptor subunit TctC